VNKPIPEDFGLDDLKVSLIEKKESEFFKKIRDKENSDGYIVLFWVSLVCFGIGFKDSNDTLVIIAAISGIFCTISFLDKISVDRKAKPDLPFNFINYKNALRKYESHLSDAKKNEEIAYIERKKEEKRQKQKTYEYWTTIDPYQFEHEIGMLFQKHGFDVKVTKGSGDQGVDIKLFRGGKKGAVQCKRYKSKVGPSTARDLYGAMMHGKYDFGFIVCPSSFSESTFEFTKNKPITLIGLKRIIEMTNDAAASFLQR